MHDNQEEEIFEDSYNEELLKGVFDSIRKKYAPAFAPEQADVHLTTQQIFEKMQGIYPSGYSADEIFRMLTDAGFKYDIGEDLTMAWMLRKV